MVQGVKWYRLPNRNDYHLGRTVPSGKFQWLLKVLKAKLIENWPIDLLHRGPIVNSLLGGYRYGADRLNRLS